MKPLLRLLPESLRGRILALYGVGLLTFILVGLGSFYYYQFTLAISDTYESASLLTEVIAPAVTDSVVIGDYDTVHRTLEKVVFRSVFGKASFIDLKGGIVHAERRDPIDVEAPRWLQLLVMPRLYDVNRNISAGGHDYGILRLEFSAEHIAGQLWTITRTALFIGICCFIFGFGLISILMRRWLGTLDRLQVFERSLEAGYSGRQELLSADAPLEIRQTFDLLNRTAASLQIQRARADVTLGAIADAVMTIDSQGKIVYANPVAFRLFGRNSSSMVGQHLRGILPAKIASMFNELAGGGAHSLRIELHNQGDTPITLECNWVLIYESAGVTAGYVLTCRDVTESQVLEQKLFKELETRKAALNSLRNVISGLQQEDDPRATFSDDIEGMSQFIAKLSYERARVTKLLEHSVRELGSQKLALDEHSLVSITNAAGTITYANEKFCELSGYSAQDLIGQTHRIVKSGLHSEQFYKEMWGTIASGKVWHGQIANRTQKGDIYWVTSTIVPWLDTQGQPYQYVAVRTNITDQKNIEHALEESKQRELEIGTNIQRSLLQDEVPDGIRGAWLASSTEPSQGIDGDFYSIRQFRPACFEILVGDVMGKGVPAALIGAAIKTTYNQVLADLLVERVDVNKDLPTPAEIVNQLHHLLTPRLIQLSAFATLALYRFDMEAGTLTYVNAGHTPGLLTRAIEQRIESIIGENLPIGVIPEEVYVQSTVAVGPSDALLVFSDGITEARNEMGEEFGIARLSELLRAGRGAALPPASLLHYVRQQVQHFSDGTTLLDDRTAVMVELHAQRQGPRGEISQRINPFLFNLPWSLDALPALRSRIEESAYALPTEDVHAVVLASYEAATNIIRHAPPLVENATLSCRVTPQDEAVMVELIYPSESFSPPAITRPDFSGESEGGFGLYIIENSVDSAEYDSPVPGIGRIRLVKRASAPPELSHRHQ